MFRTSGYFFIGLFAAALLAFWPQYLANLATGGITGYVHLHAIVMTLWVGLLIIQPFLIRSGRRLLHRTLGALSYGVGPMVVVAGMLVTHAALVRDAAINLAGAAPILGLQLAMIAWFAVCYALAIVYRKTQALHARFMIGTSLALIDPIAARVAIFYFPPLESPVRYQLISWALSVLALALLMTVERRQTRGRAVFPAMLGAITVVYTLWFTLARSPAWVGFAGWFRDLPLT